MAKSVLIVEDDFDLLFLYRSVLERGGYETVETADATEAIAQLAQRSFDLIILDLQMPDYPGTYVLDYLIQNKRFEPHIVVITANDHMADEVRQRGVKHILIKPVALLDVRSLIQSLIGT
jgi:CheY-like chemotaxis protein